jgi:hypothetical protein
VSDVRVSAKGNFAPSTFVRALTDFGPRRSQIWGNSTAGHLVVHAKGDNWADVTEGTATGGIWQRYRYDWSKPDEVYLEVTDSNAFGTGSYWRYRLTPERPGGPTRIELAIHRNPTTTKGKLFDPLLRVIGGLYFGRDLRRSIRRIEQLGPDTEPIGGP